MSGQSGSLGWNEIWNDDIESIESHLDGRQAQIHTSMPGTIVSYDPVKMTAVVQPALQVIHSTIEGKRQPTTLTTISDVPVHFPGGGKHVMTFPVKPGDDCWLVFAERSIDNWHAQGGTQPPSDWRMHDINDAVCHVGVRSQPQVPGNVSADTVQLRSDDGKTVIQLDGPNTAIKLSAAGDVVILVDGASKQVTMQVPTKVRLETPRLEVTGDVIDHCDSQGHTAADMRSIYNSHTHSGVRAGPDTTSTPSQPQRQVDSDG